MSAAAELKAHCEAKLKAAQLRVEQIVIGPTATRPAPSRPDQFLSRPMSRRASPTAWPRGARPGHGGAGPTAAARRRPGEPADRGHALRGAGPGQAARPVLRAGDRPACSTSRSGRCCAPPARWSASTPTAWSTTTCPAWTTTTCAAAARPCTRPIDEATAILAGDALQTAAFEILAHPDTHADGAVRAELVPAPGRGRRRQGHGRRPDDRPPGRARRPGRASRACSG